MLLSRAEYRSRIGNSIGVVQVDQVGATTPIVKNPTLSSLSHFLSRAVFGPKRGCLLASGTAVVASRTGWTRCKTMPLVGMARTYPSAGGTFLLCSKWTILFCRNDGKTGRRHPVPVGVPAPLPSALSGIDPGIMLSRIDPPVRVGRG